MAYNIMLCSLPFSGDFLVQTLKVLDRTPDKEFPSKKKLKYLLFNSPTKMGTWRIVGPPKEAGEKWVLLRPLDQLPKNKWQSHPTGWKIVISPTEGKDNYKLANKVLSRGTVWHFQKFLRQGSILPILRKTRKRLPHNDEPTSRSDATGSHYSSPKTLGRSVLFTHLSEKPQSIGWYWRFWTSLSALDTFGWTRSIR